MPKTITIADPTEDSDLRLLVIRGGGKRVVEVAYSAGGQHLVASWPEGDAPPAVEAAADNLVRALVQASETRKKMGL